MMYVREIKISNSISTRIHSRSETKLEITRKNSRTINKGEDGKMRVVVPTKATRTLLGIKKKAQQASTHTEYWIEKKAAAGICSYVPQEGYVVLEGIVPEMML